MEDFVEEIKDANPIETVIERLGYKFDRDHGVSRRVSHTGGLVVNTKMQRYFWASKGWNGDVVDLVMRHEGLEFKDAINWLADLAGRERPNWGKVDQTVIKAARVQASVFDVAQRVFARWLQEDAGALAYVRGRGLTDETIAETRVGFSGRGTEAFYRDMRGEFSLYGIDADEPAAVAVLGFWGDVMSWARQYGVDAALLDDKWIEKGHIAGLLGVPGVIYAHSMGRRLVYFSRRHLPGHDRIRNEEGIEREWKSWNPPRALVGERQFYFNQAWRADAQECLVVEGQMDAITLGQWGMAAVALCGLGSSPDASTWLKQKLSKHLVVYLALDADGPGQEKVRKLGVLLGPMTRIVRWPATLPGSQADDADGDTPPGTPLGKTRQGGGEADELFAKALEIAQAAQAKGKKVTISMLQRSLRIGYARATRLHTMVLDEFVTPADETGNDELEGDREVVTMPAAAEPTIMNIEASNDK